MKLVSLPNLLSLARLPLAAAFLIADSTAARITIVAAVGVSDFADGFFARRSRSHDRKSGQIVDPVTDKLFALIALLAFAIRRELTVLQLVLLLLRDIYTTFAYIILKRLHWSISFKARLSGKTVTVLQISAVFALLFWRPALRPLIWAVALMSVVAILDYTRVALRRHRTLAAAASEP